MKKKELEELFWKIEELRKQRYQLGEYDANSRPIMELVSAVQSLCIHAIQVHGLFVRIPRKVKARKPTAAAMKKKQEHRK